MLYPDDDYCYDCVVADRGKAFAEACYEDDPTGWTLCRSHRDRLRDAAGEDRFDRERERDAERVVH